MPRYKFDWANLPPELLDAMCSRLLEVGDPSLAPADALRQVYGARPRIDFIREAWPILREEWLGHDREPRLRVLEAIQVAHHDEGVIRGRRAQMDYLRRLRNAKRLREIVWEEFVAYGETQHRNTSDEHPKQPPPTDRRHALNRHRHRYPVHRWDHLGAQTSKTARSTESTSL